MKVFCLLSVGVFLLFLVACDPKATAVEKPDAQDAIDKMVYVRDSRTGLCYGVVNNQSLASGGGLRTSMIIVNVPCDKVQNLLK